MPLNASKPLNTYRFAEFIYLPKGDTNQLLAECEVSSGDTNEFHATFHGAVASYSSQSGSRSVGCFCQRVEYVVFGHPWQECTHVCSNVLWMFWPFAQKSAFLEFPCWQTAFHVSNWKDFLTYLHIWGWKWKRWRCTGMKEWRRVIDLNESDW